MVGGRDVQGLLLKGTIKSPERRLFRTVMKKTSSGGLSRKGGGKSSRAIKVRDGSQTSASSAGDSRTTRRSRRGDVLIFLVFSLIHTVL